MLPRVLAIFVVVSCGDGARNAPEGTLPEAEPCVVPAPEGVGWYLDAEGTELRDPLGRVVLLRGVNTGGRSKFDPFVPFAFDGEAGFDSALDGYWDRAASWGFSAARLVFTWEAIEAVRGIDDEVFLSRFDRIIDAAWARGIRVILDFHQDVYARMFCGDGFPEWTLPEELRQEEPEDCSAWFSGYLRNPNVRAAFDRFWADEDGVQTAYFELWDRLADRYGERPGVVGFEAINEPGWGTANPEEWERTVLSPFYATFAERVRAAAPRMLVFCDATGLDGLSASTALVDPEVPGVVFAPHLYDPNTMIEGEYVPGDQVMAGIEAWAEVGAEWDVPVLLGEFGIEHGTPGSREYFRDHMNALEAVGMHGTAWEYSVAGDLWSQENMSVVEADGTERPEILDGLVRPFLRAAAGDEPTSAYDTETRVFEASLGAAPGGVTEVALPDRVYPEGVRIGLEGGCADVDEVTRVVRIRAHDDAEVIRIELRPLRRPPP